MFKKAIRKGFAKLAALTFVLSLVAPVASQQLAYAGDDVDITIGANMQNVAVRITNADPQDPPILNSNTSSNTFTQVQGFYVRTLSDLFTQPFNFAFEDKPNYTLKVSYNNQMVEENEMSLVNGMWIMGVQAPNPGANLEVLAIYEQDQQPEPGDNLVDFEIYTQVQGGQPLGANYRYSYDGEPYEPTPDSFSKNIGDFVMTKTISFEPEQGFTSPGQLTIANQTINMNALPAGVQVYLNNFQTPFPQGHIITDQDKIIVVGTYAQEQAQEATINVSVTGLPVGFTADVSISNTNVNNVPVQTGSSQNFNVPAGGNYTVTCEQIDGFTLTINPNPAQFNNVVANQVYNVTCQYTPSLPQQATIHVSIVGPDNLLAPVDVEPGIASNFLIEAGESHNFVVPAGQNYTVNCDEVQNYDVTIVPSPAQFNNVVAGQVYNVVCQYTEEEEQQANINVTVVGLPVNTTADVTITNTQFNNVPVASGSSQNFPVDAGGNYTVSCEQIPGYTLTINPNPAQFNNVVANQVYNVTCQYTQVQPTEDEAIIRVSVTGPNNLVGAQVDITPGYNDEFVTRGQSRDFEVPAGNGQDYTVACQQIQGFNVTTVPNPAQFNNVVPGQIYNVTCQYTQVQQVNQATIRVHVDGLDNNMKAEVDITPGIANNFEIEEGDSEDFIVPAGNGQDYTVNCEENISGFDLTSNNPTQVNNIAANSVVNVYCVYDEEDDNGDGEATIRVRVEGPASLDEANVFIPGEGSRDIEEGDYYDFDVEADEDYQVYCEVISGYDLTTARPVNVNNINENQTVTVTCNYEDEDDEDTEIIRVTVQGPSSLTEANVYIPGVGSRDINNNSSYNFEVERGEDYNVYCQQISGYRLLTQRPVEIENITNTQNVTCRYEADGEVTGFRVEAVPADQYSYPGQEVSVTVRAINDTNSTVTDVVLIHDYDQSKLQLIDADGGVNDGNVVRWNLGSMLAGETESFDLRFRVIGQVNETARNNTRATTDQVNVDDVDNIVRILGAPTPPAPGPTTPTTVYVYPPTLFKSGPGLISLLFASLATLGYAAVRYRRPLINRFRAIRQA